MRLWHTFNPTETAVLNAALAARGRTAAPVETTLLPFARAQTILREVLTEGRDCPDLARIDATWLPRLAAAGVLAPVPSPTPDAQAITWLPEAKELTQYKGIAYAMPQSLDGLAIIYRPSVIKRAGVAWPPKTIQELLTAARALTTKDRFGLSVRVDGYWFVAFLRAWGVELPAAAHAESIDSPATRDALSRFAGLFVQGGVSPPPPSSGKEEGDQLRRFASGQLAAVVDGPWALPALSAAQDIAIAPFPADNNGRPAAPRGGHLFVVPRCAKQPAAAWQLATELTAPTLQADWAQRFSVVPTTPEALAVAGPRARQFYDALKSARPMRREPLTAELFDDLNPAIAAVVAGDATATEALAGVARAWTRLAQRDAGGSKTTPARQPADSGAQDAAP